MDDRWPKRLRWLVEQVWPVADPRVLVSAAEPPDGFRLVEEYLAAPSLSRVRFLIPAGGYRLMASSVGAYSRLRPPRTRMSKLVTSAALRVGLGRAVFRDRVFVSVRSDVSEAEATELLLVRHAMHRLGGQRLFAAMGVNEPSPNRKPMVQLFSDEGQPVGFLKLGATPLGRALVQRESSALGRLVGSQQDEPQRPRLLSISDWQGNPVLITGPMPSNVSLQSPNLRPTPEMEMAVATSLGPLSYSAIHNSEYWTRQQERLARITRQGTVGLDEASVSCAFADSITRLAGDATFSFGTAHGDWSFWNIGRTGQALWVWDWENMEHPAPVGIDAAHYQFQRWHLHRGLDVGAAVERSLTEGGDHFAALGLGAPAQAVVVRAHLLELYLRAVEMHDLGAGWNDRFHVPAVQAMRRLVDS